MANCRETITRALPVETVMPQVQSALAHHRCGVLQAPPGAGKTTRVPLALLNEPWLSDQKILVLEPRRLAARSCAAHMAGLLNEPLGRTVGYRIRMENKTGPCTRIEVITQGIFVRMIQNNPSLEGVGLVIFDEFHERNLPNDLGFALCLDAFNALCEELRLLVMSATMDAAGVSVLMGNAPVIVSKGRTFPVKTVYQGLENRINQPMALETICAMAINKALKETEHDILVFLPGVGEINNLMSRLDNLNQNNIYILPLYGNLSVKEQARVFSPSEPGWRKIVLATTIAQTSITIDGIGVVIDSGFTRVPRFSSSTGMTRLETVRVSKASADQRRGRAGRTGPGMCYRLWSEYDHHLLKAFDLPEISSADQSSLALELAAWGVLDPGQLKWLDPPDGQMFDRAKQLLGMLGALDQDGHITAHGKEMAALGVHPRLAHMMICAKRQGRAHGCLACLIAALITERDILVFDTPETDPDIGLRLEVINDLILKKRKGYHGFRVKKHLAEQIVRTAGSLEKSLYAGGRDKDIRNKLPGNIRADAAGTLLALAYPDRIAQKRAQGAYTFLMATGKGAYFSHAGILSFCEYIVAVHLDGSRKNARIFMAAGYSKPELEKQFSKELKTCQALVWDDAGKSVQALEQVWFKKLLIKEKKISDIDQRAGSRMLLEQIKKTGLHVLPWTKKMLSLKDRAMFLKDTGRFKGLPDLSDKAVENRLDTWLTPFLSNIFSFKQLKSIDFQGAFFLLMDWDAQQIVDHNAPTHIIVPSGSKIPLQYTGQNGVLTSPVLAVRLQEMFSLKTTPKIAGNTITVTLHLLSPAGRPVQVTNDLESFWQTTYKEVRKELMGRYPKHYWPDDPMSAIPTQRAKPGKKKN